MAFVLLRNSRFNFHCYSVCVDVCVCVCVVRVCVCERFSTDPAMEAPSEGSSLTDEDNDSVQRDQTDKEIRTLCAQMLAASTATPGSSTHVK